MLLNCGFTLKIIIGACILCLLTAGPLLDPVSAEKYCECSCASEVDENGQDVKYPECESKNSKYPYSVIIQHCLTDKTGKLCHESNTECKCKCAESTGSGPSGQNGDSFKGNCTVEEEDGEFDPTIPSETTDANTSPSKVSAPSDPDVGEVSGTSGFVGVK